MQSWSQSCSYTATRDMDGDVSTSRLFSAKQRSCLRAYYETGMRGTGEIYNDLHKKCAKECGLSVVQVKVSSNE